MKINKEEFLKWFDALPEGHLFNFGEMDKPSKYPVKHGCLLYQWADQMLKARTISAGALTVEADHEVYWSPEGVGDAIYDICKQYPYQIVTKETVNDTFAKFFVRTS